VPKWGIIALIVGPLLAIGIAATVISHHPDDQAPPSPSAPPAATATIPPITAPAAAASLQSNGGISPTVPVANSLAPRTYAPPPPSAPHSNSESKYRGRTASEWAADMADKDVDTRNAAATALYGIGTDADPAEVTPALLLGLDDANLETRTLCAATLVRFEHDDRIVPSMIFVLQNSTRFPDWTMAAQALGEMGPSAKAAVPALTACRQQAADGLDANTPESSPSLIAKREIDAALAKIGE
jgi:hypothetical protein